jgi:hypothetical protein
VDEPNTVAAERVSPGSTDPGETWAPAEAWSLEVEESDDPAERHTWPGTWMRAGLLAFCATLIAGVVGVVGWATMPRHNATQMPATHDHRPAPGATPVAAPPIHHVVAPLAAPKPPAPSTTPAPSPTVTIEASPPVQREVPPPPPPVAAPELPAPAFDPSRDQWLLNNMRSLGYTIMNPPLVIANAHEACRLLQQGESTDQMNQQMQARMGASTLDTLQLTSSAMLAYPNCY